MGARSQSQDQLPKSWNLYTLLYIMNSLKKTTTFLLEEKKSIEILHFFLYPIPNRNLPFFCVLDNSSYPSVEKKTPFCHFFHVMFEVFTSKTLFYKKKSFHINGILFLFQKTQKHTSIESPLKTEGSSDSLDGTKYIKNSREFFILNLLKN